MKSLSPLLGFNNNVKHRGKVFHIQTEDSGVKHPHVITHLFVDGGRILKSVKTSYAEFLEDEQISVRVRQLMQEQHKAMFIALRAGKFDHLVEGGEPPAAGAVPPATPSGVGEPAPPSPAAVPHAPPPPPAQRPPPERGPTVREPIRARDLAPPPPPPPDDKPPPSAPAPQSMRPTPHELKPPSLRPPPPRVPSLTNERAVGTDRRADPRAETLPNVPATTAAAEARARLASPALELNLEALGRSSGEAKPWSISSGDVRDLPPPPAAVMGRRPTTFNTGYRSIQSDPRAEPDAPRSAPLSRGSRSDIAAVPRPPSLTPPPSTRTPRPPASSPGGASSGSGSPGGIDRPMERRSMTPQGARYAPSRPASIFGSARPQEGSSIFGEDLISEKSLDEVILSYLAEDLEGSKPKR